MNRVQLMITYMVFVILINGCSDNSNPVSSDSAHGWKQISQRIGGNIFNDVSFSDRSNGTVVGWFSQILRTTDGGLSWKNQSNSAPNWTWFNSVHFTDANNGTVVGRLYQTEDGIIIRTTNGGATWVTQLSGSSPTLSSVFFTDAATGIAVGRSGTILRTTNGGSTWAAQNSGTYLDLNDVYFIDKNYGWVVGGDEYNLIDPYAIILRTTNGGVTWISQSNTVTNRLNGVSFYDKKNGLAVGQRGTILITGNGGLTWNIPNSPTLLDLNEVTYSNANTWWVCGGDDIGQDTSVSVLLKSTNGGTGWLVQPKGIINSNFHGIIFPDASHGCVVGEHETILLTTNGGM